MKTGMKLMLAGACAAALGTAALGAFAAEPSGPRATLYEYPNFQGRSVTIYRSSPNLADSNFNDMGQSGHFDGDWTLCTDSDFRGQCQRVAGDVTNLNTLGLGRAVSSLQQGGVGGTERYGGNDRDTGRYGDNDQGRYGDNDRGRYGDNDRAYDHGAAPVNPGPLPPTPAPGYQGDRYGGAQFGGASLQGRSVVFFPRPQSNGQDIAAYNRGAADWFCRRQGLGAAVYSDTSTRGRGFRFQEGGFAINAPVLRDVLCRRY